MQFMKLCKERPDDMASLDAIGLVASEQPRRLRKQQHARMASAADSAPNSIGLDGPGETPFDGKSFEGGDMAQFQSPAGRSSEERFAASIPREVSGSVPFPPPTLGQTNSTSGILYGKKCREIPKGITRLSLTGYRFL
jgi:hypothetical protein